MTQLSRRILSAAFASALLIGAAGAQQSKKPEIYTERGLALGGYDPVAYFTAGKPTEGKAEFTHSWKGAVWRFASAGNRDAFKAAPEKYAPQYGGYCAYAVARGYTASTEPDAWRIVAGKLYLNYNGFVRSLWDGDRPGHIAAGDRNWPKALDK